MYVKKNWETELIINIHLLFISIYNYTAPGVAVGCYTAPGVAIGCW